MDIKDFAFSEYHHWINFHKGSIFFGLTDTAQKELKKIFFVELPEIGSIFQRGDVCGSIESKTGLADIIIPLSGEVEKINEDLDVEPELINTSPYENGWLMKIRLYNEDELSQLMSYYDYLLFSK